MLQIETEQTEDILLQNYNIRQNLGTDSWIKSLWEFVHGQKIQIKSSKKIIPQLSRENDTAIVNEFIRQGYKEADLVRLNTVRNHQKALYMSDITEGNGRKSKKKYLTVYKTIR